MSARVALVLVVLAAVGPGVLFAPVFGVGALVAPLGVVAVLVWLVGEAARRWEGVVAWRALLALVVGLVGVVEVVLADTTVAGLPTGETVRALAAGVTDSWQLTLQSTWPARPDPELLLFVPLLALCAAVLAVELVERVRLPLVALLPGLGVVVLSQAYVALDGFAAIAAGLGFALLAAALLVARGPAGRRGAVLVAPTVVLAVAGAVLVGSVDLTERPAHSLRQDQGAPLPPRSGASPLDRVAERLLDGDRPVFSYTADAPVDRWRLVVLDHFDGASWTAGSPLRRLGSELGPRGAADPQPRRASVRVTGLDEPWVPSQPLPAAVDGVAPLVDESSGMLVVPDRAGPVAYDLTWWDPAVGSLLGAGVDEHARTGFGDVGQVPPGVAELARAAVHDLRPSFQSALLLEKFFTDSYRVATRGELPTGNGWHQLERFLLETKEGTSEQFATAYTLLARILSIPARVAVGFRAPAGAPGEEVVVRNKDVLAWPEVAVKGVGWVALDPTGGGSGTGGGSKLAEVTEEARGALPEPRDLVDPSLPDDEQTKAEAGDDPGFSLPVTTVLLALGATVVVAVAAIPLVRAARAWWRGRRRGAGAVVGAWEEARDRLRAHGVPVTTGMTVRDLAGTVPDPPVVDGLRALADRVDLALWSPGGPDPATAAEAWSAVREVRRGLARRPLGARLRAALHVRSLFPLR
ncbi:transglutaminaseTgpA domain-containing protein [Actinokineospora sp. G85]|uniref:transglutaminase family protein n=1 Tax=Actinokineospora sp. G85 TaxID=3406626 RepID=UPI003C737E17